MKIESRWLASGVLVLALGIALQAQEAVPPGTIIPVALKSSISSEKAKPGMAVSARVMQDVPLPNNKKIREGSKVTGHVTAVQQGSNGAGPSVSLAFDHVLIGKEDVPITTDLRAIASFSEVDGAQIPAFGMGEGESWNNRVTTQVGGDTVYWGGGPVVSWLGPVGKPLGGSANTGVLVKVTSKPGSPCRGEVEGNDRVQALWVFSSDACGVYSMDGLTIAHAGRTEPLGVIELSTKEQEVKVPSGSGMLLRVISK